MWMLANRLLQTGSALITLLASPVMAADMPVKTSLPPPAAPAFSWTGVYFGLNAGWLAADNSMVNQATPTGVEEDGLAALATGSFSLGNKSGFIGGAEIGYNYQFNNWVAGIEADIQGISGQAVNGSITSTSGQLSSTLGGVHGYALARHSPWTPGLPSDPDTSCLRHRRSGVQRGLGKHCAVPIRLLHEPYLHWKWDRGRWLRRTCYRMDGGRRRGMDVYTELELQGRISSLRSWHCQLLLVGAGHHHCTRWQSCSK
jgi:hypothetical protein